MYVYIYIYIQLGKGREDKGEEQWRGFISRPEEEVVPERCVGDDLLCLLAAPRGNLLPQSRFEKKGDLDYKMESVNKRHFQGTTFNCWETIHYSTSTIRVIYRGGGGTGERLTLLPV